MVLDWMSTPVRGETHLIPPKSFNSALPPIYNDDDLEDPNPLRPPSDPASQSVFLRVYTFAVDRHEKPLSPSFPLTRFFGMPMYSGSGSIFQGRFYMAEMFRRASEIGTPSDYPDFEAYYARVLQIDAEYAGAVSRLPATDAPIAGHESDGIWGCKCLRLRAS